jgi:hypothetical protein
LYIFFSAKKYWYEYVKQHPKEKGENEEEKMMDAKGGNLDVTKKNTEMIHMILELLSGSNVGNLIMTLTCRTDTAGLYDDPNFELGDVEIEFYGKLLELDPEYAVKLLQKNKPWETWVPGTNDEAIDNNREKWIEFLKQHAPEFLADFIKMNL